MVCREVVMHKLLFSLIGTLFILGFASAKIACVDTNRILAESKLVAKAQAELRSKLEEYRLQLTEKEKRLEELKKQIESKAISQKAKEEKIKEYQKIENEVRQLQAKAQAELNQMKQRLENMVFNRVKEAAEKVAHEKGYSGVVDCAVFLYREASMDITTEIIELIDANVSTKSE